MNLKPTIQQIPAKKLVGKRLTMSLINNKTGKLWSSFMPVRKTIENAANDLLYSLQVYEPSYFKNFEPAKEFEKWAAIEVTDIQTIPEGMETLTLPAGLYAVFHYKGLSSNPSIFQYIFGTWLRQSDYALDDRPHFELLGEKYKNNDPESEEDIYIPVKPK
jgi:AraC family transcriptional regulator